MRKGRVVGRPEGWKVLNGQVYDSERKILDRAAQAHNGKRQHRALGYYPFLSGILLGREEEHMHC